MWKKYPDESGFYWFYSNKDEIFSKTVCKYVKISKIVLFLGGDLSGTPLEHLDFLDGFWLGPLEAPKDPIKEEFDEQHQMD